MARKTIFDTTFIASSIQQDLEQEQQIRHRYSDAFDDLCIRYNQLTTKNLSLSKEAEQSKKTLSEYRFAFEELKLRATDNEDKILDLEMKRAETAKNIQVVIDKNNSTAERIEELEKEKADLIQRYQAEITMRVAREGLAARRFDELQEGVDIMVQEHQAAMNVATNRLKHAEEEVENYRNVLETKHGGRRSKHRKCKDTIAMKVEDMAGVQE